MAATNTNLATGKIGIPEVALSANTVDSVTFADDLDTVEVIVDGTAAADVTTDGSTPTVNGTNGWHFPAGIIGARTLPVPTSGPTVVKLVSAGTPKYTVQRGA